MAGMIPILVLTSSIVVEFRHSLWNCEAHGPLLQGDTISSNVNDACKASFFMKIPAFLGSRDNIELWSSEFMYREIHFA